jgi:(hydroxyamino)benzene mutase
MSEGLQGLLAFSGTLLFLIGLLSGFAIPFLRSPRIGLSAHVAALQSGLALLAVAWVGGRLTLPDGWAAAIAHTLWISLYVLWIGLLFAGAYGTGRTLPLAGAGLRAKPWQETTALVLIGAASLGSAAAFAALLWHWSWKAI